MRNGSLFRPAVSGLWLGRRFGFARSAFRRDAKSLGGHFFLFAFHAHGFELALFGFDGCGDFGLDLGCRFFELWGGGLLLFVPASFAISYPVFLFAARGPEPQLHVPWRPSSCVAGS